MKQKHFLLFIFLLLAIIFNSCAPAYDMRWYKSTSKKKEVIPPDVVPDIGITLPPAGAVDPFKTDDSPKENAGGFNAIQFKDWRIKASFSASNVPTYTFSGTGWDLKDEARQKYQYNGDNTLAGDNKIRNVVYYQYRNKHPLFPPDNSYNKDPHAERLQRFYFYWFEGDTAMPHLDNALIAVDSYSKLVFAFAKPTDSKIILGNKVPLAWGQFEIYSEGPGGQKYKFYEYDPIGYVKSDGSVVLYEWARNALAGGDYEPRMQYIGGQVAGTEPGRSPYSPTMKANDNQTSVSGNLTIKVTSIYNESVSSSTYDRKWAWTKYRYKKQENKACYIYSFAARAYSGFDNPKYDVIADKNKGNSVKDGALVYSAGQVVNLGGTHDINKEKSFSFADIKQDMFFSFQAKLLRYNYEAAVWNTIYGRKLKKSDMLDGMRDEIKILDAITFPFTFDRAKNAWAVGENSVSGDSIIEYDKNFTLTKGENKDFVIRTGKPDDGITVITLNIAWN